MLPIDALGPESLHMLSPKAMRLKTVMWGGCFAVTKCLGDSWMTPEGRGMLPNATAICAANSGAETESLVLLQCLKLLFCIRRWRPPLYWNHSQHWLQ